jgi:hypothetical protein
MLVYLQICCAAARLAAYLHPENATAAARALLSLKRPLSDEKEWTVRTNNAGALPDYVM